MKNIHYFGDNWERANAFKYYFYNKINWKLIHDIAHIATTYEDEGLITKHNMYVLVRKGNAYLSVWNMTFGYCNIEEYEKSKRSAEEYGLFYGFSFGEIRGGSDPIMEKYENEAIEKLRKKYNIKMEPNINDVIRFQID